MMVLRLVSFKLPSFNDREGERDEEDSWAKFYHEQSRHHNKDVTVAEFSCKIID